METEQNRQLPFLDKRNPNFKAASFYQKPTFSGLGLRFFQLHSFYL